MNFNTLPISPKNCITFNKNTFDLSYFYVELSTFYHSVGLDNTVYYAHAFNKNGLFYNPYPISGFQVTENEQNSSFFRGKDIRYARYIENNAFPYDSDFTSLYKYNILSLYVSVLKPLKGFNNGYNPLFTYKNKIEEDEFYLFINKNPLNMPEFDFFKDMFIKEYILMQ